MHIWGKKDMNNWKKVNLILCTQWFATLVLYIEHSCCTMTILYFAIKLLPCIVLYWPISCSIQLSSNNGSVKCELCNCNPLTFLGSFAFLSGTWLLFSCRIIFLNFPFSWSSLYFMFSWSFFSSFRLLFMVDTIFFPLTIYVQPMPSEQTCI